jgi:hypothetical protein
VRRPQCDTERLGASWHDIHALCLRCCLPVGLPRSPDAPYGVLDFGNKSSGGGTDITWCVHGMQCAPKVGWLCGACMCNACKPVFVGKFDFHPRRSWWSSNQYMAVSDRSDGCTRVCMCMCVLRQAVPCHVGNNKMKRRVEVRRAYSPLLMPQAI